jgi:hypothetical protein
MAVWSRSRASAACIIDTIGSRLPEDIPFLMRMICG